MGQKGVAIGLATLYVISPTKAKQNLWNICCTTYKLLVILTILKEAEKNTDPNRALCLEVKLYLFVPSLPKEIILMSAITIKDFSP